MTLPRISPPWLGVLAAAAVASGAQASGCHLVTGADDYDVMDPAAGAATTTSSTGTGATTTTSSAAGQGGQATTSSTSSGTGATGGGGDGGSAGAGGWINPCADRLDCAACAMCAISVPPCDANYDDCMANTACSNLVGCALACGFATACVQACPDFAAGSVAFAPLAQCVGCTTCTPQCGCF